MKMNRPARRALVPTLSLQIYNGSCYRPPSRTNTVSVIILGYGFLEYFIKGTEPEESPVIDNEDESTGETSASSYLESPDL